MPAVKDEVSWDDLDQLTRDQLTEFDRVARTRNDSGGIVGTAINRFLIDVNSTAVRKAAVRFFQDENRDRAVPLTDPSARARIRELCCNAAWDDLRQRFASTAAEISERAKQRIVEEDLKRSPWKNRKGWRDEEALPIREVTRMQRGEEVTLPVEPGYELYNTLVGPKNYRPFRTTTGDLRVAVPSRHGLQIWNPISKEGTPSTAFIAGIGYAHYTLKGDPVPTRDVSCAVMALAGRALSGDLPPERVVDLWVRFAPEPGFGGRVDLADPMRRCIVVGPDGWHLEDVGHPTFDPKGHMRPLPVPEPSTNPAEGWKRIEQLWRFVPISKGSAPSNPRLLALADQVQQILGANTPKTVKIITGEEGIGKSTIAGFYQALLDPSTVEVVAPPSDEEDLINLATNHATVNLDNVSYISHELSDNISRLSTGIGLTKRKLFSDSEEVSLSVLRSVILNGITATPRAADMLRRCLFLPVDTPRPQLARAELKAAWSTAHPTLLGGLLDLAVLTARVLRDAPPPPSHTSMADYVRVGQAVAIAMGLSPDEFVSAWSHNEAAQQFAAAEDPWVSVLAEYFEMRTPTSEPVRSEDIARWVNRDREGLFGRAITPQQVGIAIQRSSKTLRRMHIHVRSVVRRGYTAYVRYEPEPESLEQAPPVPPVPPHALSSFDELQDGREGGVVATTSGGGTREIESHPGSEPHPGVVGLASSPTTVPPPSPTTVSSSIDVLRGGTGDTLSTIPGELGKGGPPSPDPEDLFAGLQTRADRARRTWEAEAEKRKRGESTPDVRWSSIGPFVEYPGGTVADRATGDTVWSPGDPPELRPKNPDPGQSKKPHTKRGF
jgi:hypothetical protein